MPLFDQLKANAKDEKLLALCDYYFQTWLDSPVWTLEEINVYLQPIRTCNDVEGWHNRLKVKSGRSNLQMYLLIDSLKQEADNVEVTLKLVSRNCLYKIHTEDFDSSQQSLIDDWNRFCATGIPIGELHNRFADKMSQFLDIHGHDYC